jgi:hypothetical protein
MFVSNEQQQEENRMDTFDMDTFMESLTGSEAVCDLVSDTVSSYADVKGLPCYAGDDLDAVVDSVSCRKNDSFSLDGHRFSLARQDSGDVVASMDDGYFMTIPMNDTKIEAEIEDGDLTLTPLKQETWSAPSLGEPQYPVGEKTVGWKLDGLISIHVEADFEECRDVVTRAYEGMCH